MEREKKEGAGGTMMEVTGEGMGEEGMVMTTMEEAMATMMAMGMAGVTGTMMVMEREEGRGRAQAALLRVHIVSATIAR